MKFIGSFEEMKQIVARTQVRGEWIEPTETKCTFRSKRGAVLNWWPKTGTVLVQGEAAASKDLEQRVETEIERTEASIDGATVVRDGPQRQIFVVHGHDVVARDQLELVLHRLGLEPFILMNTSGGGKTIIEALEGQIGRDYSTDFGIVLMTPDDVGFAKSDGPEKAEPRTRQNVVLETGMLLSSLTRKRMALLVKGHVELPSDLQGIIQLRFNDQVKEVVPKLCIQLRDAGIKVDASRIAGASA